MSAARIVIDESDLEEVEELLQNAGIMYETEPTA